MRLPQGSTLVPSDVCSSMNSAWRSPLQVQRRDGLVGDDQGAAAAHVLLQQLRLVQQPGADVDGVRPVAQVHVHLRGLCRLLPGGRLLQRHGEKEASEQRRRVVRRPSSWSAQVHGTDLRQ